MEENVTKTEIDDVKKFKRRLDFYWQFIAVYAVVLLIYSMMKNIILENSFTFVFDDAVSILLTLFIFITLLSVLFQEFKQRSIVLSDDFIILKTRFREKKYTLDMIRKISMSKDRRIRSNKPVRVIKIWVQNRRLPLKIRPSTYQKDTILMNELMNIKKKMRDQKISQ